MRCQVADENVASGPRSYEIRIECPAADQPNVLKGLRRYGVNRVIDDGLWNCATITGFKDALYFVVTDGHGQRQRGDNGCRAWENQMKKVTCHDLRKLPEVAKVKWVRELTRFAQRRFGWGDAQATKEEVETAARDGNGAELLAILPEAAPLVHRGELQHLPALFEALKSGAPPALADCQHQFRSPTEDGQNSTK